MQALTEFDGALLDALFDLPETIDPYETVAQSLGCAVDDVIDGARSLLERKVIRRFGAVVRHTKAGLKANAMLVASVDEGVAERAASPFVESEHVSHCYLRKASREWPYNFYAMIHARTTDELDELAESLAAAAGIAEYRLLYSVKEYKKTGWRWK